MIKRELKILLTAIMFYTRIPVGNINGYSNEMLNRATRYFPFVGYIVGGLGALVFTGFNQIANQQIAVVAAFIIMVLITGAFHEDALADFCDGFGGGYTPGKVLSIMKDSRIGTYGAMGLILLFLFKYVLFISMDAALLPIWLILAHVFSRFLVVVLIFTSTYVRDAEGSKSKPVGQKNTTVTFLIALIWIGPLFCFFEPISLVVILLIQTILFVCFRFYVKKRIGGYTGDVLGALQQLSETLFFVLFYIYNAMI